MFLLSPVKKWKWKRMSLSRVQLFGTSWTVARHASLSLGFPRQEYWSRLPFPSLGDLPELGIEPQAPTLQADFSTVWTTREARIVPLHIVFSKWREFNWFPSSKLFLSCDANMDLILKPVIDVFSFIEHICFLGWLWYLSISISLYYSLTIFMKKYIYIRSFYIWRPVGNWTR